MVSDKKTSRTREKDLLVYEHLTSHVNITKHLLIKIFKTLTVELKLTNKKHL